MPVLEGLRGINAIRRFIEKRPENNLRNPGIIVLEFGGGGCNKAGEPSCRDYCAVPRGKQYDPTLDPSIETLSLLLKQISTLKPAFFSIVPNGEIIDTLNDSNTDWKEIFELSKNKSIKEKQLKALIKYANKYSVNLNRPMKPAEKVALTIALGTNMGLNISLTSNGSFLNKDLLKLYSQMGLQAMNLTYHPNSPFNPEKYNPDLEYLIARAEEAIACGIIPVIPYVLTSKNADSYVAVADYISEHDIFFGALIAQGKGMNFSANNKSIEPSVDQVKMVFRRLLARRLFADRPIRTTLPYLMMAPYMPNWMCGQTTDFFHISVQFVDGKLQPRLNVCSEVRPNDAVMLENFLVGGKLDVDDYLKWRTEAMKDSNNGCPSCINQCYFETELRDFTNPLELWSYFETAAKAFRLRYLSRKPIRPTVSKRKDFQNPYLWESLLQGIARQVASLAGDKYWQETFKRSGVEYDLLVETCIEEAKDPLIVEDLINQEKKDYSLYLWENKKTFSVANEWYDQKYWQSKLLRWIYDLIQTSAIKGGVTEPARYTQMLRHQNIYDFQDGVKNIVEQRKNKSILIRKKQGRIFPFIKINLELLTSFLEPRKLIYRLLSTFLFLLLIL